MAKLDVERMAYQWLETANIHLLHDGYTTEDLAAAADFARQVARACARVAGPDLKSDTVWTQRVWGRHEAAAAIRQAVRKGKRRG